MDGLFSFVMSHRGLLVFCLLWTLSTGEDCLPFPEGQVTPDDTTNVILPGDTIQYAFRLNWTFPAPVKHIVVNITGTSLKFPHNDSVSWQLGVGTDPLQDRNSSSLVSAEFPVADSSHSIRLESIGSANGTLEGHYTMVLKDSAGAGDLVQSEMEVTVTHLDNSTCYTSVSSSYFYLPPPRIWLSDVLPEPVPMMSELQGLVHMLITNPSSLGPSSLQLRTPIEESSEEVILTFQGASVIDHEGFTDGTAESLKDLPLSDKNSSFGSFQCDYGEFDLPPLQRKANGTHTHAQLTTRFLVRAEDYSQLRDGDVVNLTLGVSFGRGRRERRGLGDEGGASFIWVTSVAATLEVPPLHLKRPVLNLTIVQKASCAYDGHTRAQVEVKLMHDPTSTASAYNVTARVYLPEYMEYIRYTTGELRRNTMELTEGTNVLYIDIERMTFSDTTTATLTLDVDLTDPHRLLAGHHVITADAVFCDRWGNDTDMLTAVSYVALNLDRKCSQRVTWTTGKFCKCSHDDTRSDCACCKTGACQCGSVNLKQCQPCEQTHLCGEPYLPGWGSITELDGGDGETTYVCDPHHRYRPLTKGISCYKNISYDYYALNPIIGAILARDGDTGNLYGISNNGLAHMRSVDQGFTWYTIIPEEYASVLQSDAIVSAVTIPGHLN